MAKRYETFEHTADMGLRAEADSRQELYEALAECLADQICRRDSVQPMESRDMSVDSTDPEALAVDFLARLLLLMQSDGFLVHRVKVTHCGPADLQAELIGEPLDWDRHELGPEIKAVTYHLLEVRERAGRWHGQVVLDL